jgi:hypothetical protein
LFATELVQTLLAFFKLTAQRIKAAENQGFHSFNNDPW